MDMVAPPLREAYVGGMEEARRIREGQIGVLPTDTLYGLVASALDSRAVERVYAAKARDARKPCIVLLSSVDDLSLFGIELTEAMLPVVMSHWPGPVSIVLACGTDVPEYLHRGTQSLAFRVPNDPWLIDFLRVAGPIIAPSANPEGRLPATMVDEARAYFADVVDFYITRGVRNGSPSKLIALNALGEVTLLREPS